MPFDFFADEGFKERRGIVFLAVSAPDYDFFFGSGDAGINEFSGDHWGRLVWENHQHFGEFGALAFVDGHGID